MLRFGPPPHGQPTPGMMPITVVFALAALVVAGSGVVLFGWYAVRVVAISVAVSLLGGAAFNATRQGSASWSESHALLIGVLFGCTLPATASWPLVATGAFIAVIVGELLAGGVGNYLWHPVALARVAVQILFYNELNSTQSPVLAPGNLLWGTLDRAQPLPPLAHWRSEPLESHMQAWLVTPTENLLRQPLPRTDTDPASALVSFVRDLAPSWADTLTGVAGGAIGEACFIAILTVGLLLLWRGLLRWSLISAGLIAAALAAAILPVATTAPGSPITLCLLPGLRLSQAVPVGAAYVLYHLTAGGFLFVLFVLAPDPSSSPLTARGHMLFGGIIGLLTIVLRVSMGVPAAAYWALLIANTFVPTIDRLTRRRVLGT